MFPPRTPPVRFTMVCSFRLFHTSWTSGPVNDWYHTCKFTGHVVFMGSSNLAAATFENNFNWKAVHAPVLNKHYSCQIRSHLSSAKTLFHKLLNLQCTFSPVHARHSDIQKHQKGLCDVALSCHGMDFIAVLAALGCRGFSRTSSRTINPSQSFFSSWSNLESRLNWIRSIAAFKIQFQWFQWIQHIPKKTKLQHLQLINWSIA